MYELDTTYDGFKWIIPDDNTQNIVVFKRFDKQGDYTIIVVNFSPVERKDYSIGVPDNTTYNVVLNSDSKLYGGCGNSPVKYKAVAGEMHGEKQYINIYIPANSVQYIKPKPVRNTKKKKVID